MLNTNSPVPLYHQLADILLAKIRSGEYSPGEKIPSEHKLSEKYGIGRPTARQATDLLVRKNKLFRRRGSGTFVKNKREEIDLFSLAGTMSSFQKKVVSVETEILQNTEMVDVGGNTENPFFGSSAFFFSRLSTVEGDPVLLEEIYLHPEMFPEIDKIDITGESLSQIVEEHYYLKPAEGKQNFRICTIPGKKAQIMRILPDTPLLLVKRYLHFAQMKNSIYSELYCRTDRFVFSQTIGGYSND